MKTYKTRLTAILLAAMMLFSAYPLTEVLNSCIIIVVVNIYQITF